MNIQFNKNAKQSYEVFNLTEQRADDLLTSITNLLVNVRNTFPEQYSVETEEGFRISIGQILEEILSLGANDNERVFLLYIAHTGVSSLINEFDRMFEVINNEQ